MARGDVVSSQASVLNNANFTYQPSAGVEVMVTFVGIGDNVALTSSEILIGITDGTNITNLPLTAPGITTSAGISNASTLKIFINNTRYLVVANLEGTTRYIGFTGVQTK